MTTKSMFSDQEWAQLLQAPFAAGMYIIIADPSFVVGSMKEAFALSSGILKKAKDNNSELLSSLLVDLQQTETIKQAQIKFEQKDIAAMKKKITDSLDDATQLLNLKATPEECEEIKNWLYDLSVKTANAAKEGGFLGFGGTRVTENETIALQEISRCLGITA